MADLSLDIFGERPGVWIVVVSDKALRSFHSQKRAGNFERVISKLRDLAAGDWTYKPSGTKEQQQKWRVPLAQTRCHPNTFILWQVDVKPAATSGADTQIVKVWDIGTRDEIFQSIDRIIAVQRAYPNQNVIRCRQRPATDKDGKHVPTIFVQQDQIAPDDYQRQELDVRTVDRQVFEMNNRFYTLTEPMIRSVFSNDLLAEFPFDFSGDEARSILHVDSSSLILGRSGTGKTTCLVFKLLAKYAASSTTAEGNPPPRQVLLTKSNELAGKLKQYMQRLLRTVQTASINDDEEQGNGDHPQEEEENGHPLPQYKQTYADEDGLNLPDDQFPLVCTFDYLLELVEEVIQRNVNQQLEVPRPSEARRHAEPEEEGGEQEDRFEGDPTLDPHLQKDTHLVDFQAFKLYYWPKFPPALVKNISVELAFAEIMGVIKGSISTVRSLTPLPRGDYLNLSSKMAPAFNLQGDKSRVFDLFEKYETLKSSRGEQDGADRVTKIIATLRERQNVRAVLSAMFDEIYVDEVQDLRGLDIELLLNIINDGRGFHFAGDTAQTISPESHFRFDEVKKLFYEHFSNASSLTGKLELARPQLFLLAKNYRSHQGILGLASLVMEMLWKAFPETVDKLKPEVAQMRGPVPVFLLGCSAQTLLASSSESIDADDDHHHAKPTIDFGAEQAIIVRDEATKMKVRDEIGESALVLTILQSKGMEFEDVLLFNFFTDTPCAAGWRSLDKLKNESRGDFSISAGMCSELKHFYVSITRARIRLLIIETEEDLAARVADVLKEDTIHPLVEVTTSLDPTFQKQILSLRSIHGEDSERWSERGYELMQRALYEDAAICFRRAKNIHGENSAVARIVEEKARMLASANKTKAAQDCFRSAAQKFTELEDVPSAVRNLERAEEFKQAAELWLGRGKLGEAALSLAKGKMFKDAAELWVQVGNPSKAAAMFDKIKMHKEAAILWDSYDKPEEAAFFFNKGGMFKEAAQMWIRYDDPSKAESYFVKGEMFEQAANMWAERKKPEEAAPMFGKAKMYKKAHQHYHQASAYDSAAEALQKGNYTQELVTYLGEKQRNMSGLAYNSCCRFCFLQLKQQNISQKHREEVIRLLRDPSQQEKAFLEYDMPSQLSNLYSRQGRFQDLFLHFYRRGEIHGAVDTLRNLEQDHKSDRIQTLVERAKDFYFTERIVRLSSGEKVPSANLKAPGMGWSGAESLMMDRARSPPTVIFDRLEILPGGVAKSLSRISLLLISRGWLDTMTYLGQLPFSAIGEARRIAESVLSQRGGESDRLVVLLLAGVLETDLASKPSVILSWSPLLSHGRQQFTKLQPKEYTKGAYDWFLITLSTIVLKFHEKLKELWKFEWPERCAIFLTGGRCGGAQRCSRLHKMVDKSDCQRKVNMLFEINAVICSFTAIYGKKVMTGEFQEKFAGIRRLWLERLIRELTFVSSVAQSSEVVMDTCARLTKSVDRPPYEEANRMLVARSLEDLSFHRLGKDWTNRSGFSSLLEQIQFSIVLGNEARTRFLRSLKHKCRVLSSFNSDVPYDALLKFWEVEKSIESPNTTEFVTKLRSFNNVLQQIGLHHFSSLHSVSSAYELFATYLINRSYREMALIPQSWINLHLPRLAPQEQTRLSEAPQEDHQHVFAKALLELIRCFCEILAFVPTTNFPPGPRGYPARLLHQRNIDLLLISGLNLVFNNREPKEWQSIKRKLHDVFFHEWIRGPELIDHNWNEILTNQASSFSARYNGKDNLVFVKGPSTSHSLGQKMRELGVPTMLRGEMLSKAASAWNLGGTAGDWSDYKQSNESNTKEQENGEDTGEREKAARRIWNFWIERRERLLARKTFLSSPVGQLHQQLSKMCDRHHDACSLDMRMLLSRKGVPVYMMLSNLRAVASDLQERTAAVLDEVPAELFLSVDEVVQMTSEVLQELEGISDMVDMATVEEHAAGGSEEEEHMKELFEMAKTELEKVEAQLNEVKKKLSKEQFGKQILKMIDQSKK
ncbi:MAG: hypothetical protein M1831_007451 [Alyxoria varia]|nr:MAG: hypothetical protein M1831_007451 [Alyxoria varia]